MAFGTFTVAGGERDLHLRFAQIIISENPCKAVALPKLEHKEMQTIPAEQLHAFLTEAKATGVCEMYYIELATGLHRGELLGLKWSDIDWKNGIIKVRRQIARVDGKTVSGMLGHFSTGFTLDTYAHVTTSHRKKPPRPLETCCVCKFGFAVKSYTAKATASGIIKHLWL